MGKKVKDESSNPWSASSIFDFYFFCCPECDDKSKSKQDFVNHASAYHTGVSYSQYAQVESNKSMRTKAHGVK